MWMVRSGVFMVVVRKISPPAAPWSSFAV